MNYAVLTRVLQNLFATFAVPAEIVTNNGSSFVSAFTGCFFKNNCVRHVTSAHYRPARNR